MPERRGPSRASGLALACLALCGCLTIGCHKSADPDTSAAGSAGSSSANGRSMAPAGPSGAGGMTAAQRQGVRAGTTK